MGTYDFGTILLVDDEEPFRALARRVLVEQGFTVLTAPDAESAIAVANRHPGAIHLLIAEVALPTASGRELAARFTIHRPGTKVLYISDTSNGMVTRHRVLEPGTAFLEKPFSLERLLATVRQLVAPAEPARPSDRFDALACQAAQAIRAPIGLISLADGERQYVKGAFGPPASLRQLCSLPAAHSVCQTLAGSGRPVAVDDARLEPELHEHPAVHAMGIVAYIAVPVTDESGRIIGSVCAIDTQPRKWELGELATLRDVAASTAVEIAHHTGGSSLGSAPGR